MSRSTISTFQLFEMFPDAESARTNDGGRAVQKSQGDKQPQTPDVLDRIADRVLAYRPKEKRKRARKRKRPKKAKKNG